MFATEFVMRERERERDQEIDYVQNLGDYDHNLLVCEFWVLLEQT